MCIKALYLLVNVVSSWNDTVYLFDDSTVAWYAGLVSRAAAKVGMSIAANYGLLRSIPVNEKRFSKMNMLQGFFRLALVGSFVCEPLFESECLETVSIFPFVAFALYENLFFDLLDRRLILCLELYRVAAMLALSGNVLRASMMVGRDMLLCYGLSVFKRFLVTYLIRLIQEKHENAGLLFDARQLTDKSSAAVFIVAMTVELRIEYKNAQAGKLL